METIDLIVYLGRVRSAIDDMQYLQGHEVPHSTGARVELVALHAHLLAMIKARPDVGAFVTFGDVENMEGAR